MDGKRMGTGIHNCVVVPAGTSVSLDPSPQSNGILLETDHTPTTTLPGKPCLLRIRDVEPQGDIAAILDQMQREQIREPLMFDAANIARLELVSIWIARQLATLEDTGKPKATERLLSGFVQMLETRHRDGVDMQTYAGALDVTPTHLSRSCKRHLGKTAAELVTERTLHATMTALLDSQTRIKDIAEGLGFRSPAYFSRFVLAHCGKSPRDVRKTGPLRMT